MAHATRRFRRWGGWSWEAFYTKGMKTSLIRIAGVAALLMGMLAWIYGGAQMGFYKTYYTIQKTDAITGLSYEEKIDAFLPGIETLFFGFVAFSILIIASGVLETRQASE